MSTFPELSSSPGEKVLLVILNSFTFVNGVGVCVWKVEIYAFVQGNLRFISPYLINSEHPKPRHQPLAFPFDLQEKTCPRI